METAPKDRPILVHHCDKADIPWDELTNTLSTYASHLDGLPRTIGESLQIAVFGGGWDERGYEEPHAGYADDWWFRDDGEFEHPLNPIAWAELPPLSNIAIITL